MSEPVRFQYTPRATATHTTMASLLHAAKWLRSAVCAASVIDRPPLPEPVQLQPLGLSGAALAGLVPQVQGRLAEVSSLLEVGDVAAVDRERFPAQAWRS